MHGWWPVAAQVFRVYGENGPGTINGGCLAGNFIDRGADDKNVKILTDGRRTAGTFFGARIEVQAVVFCDD